MVRVAGSHRIALVVFSTAGSLLVLLLLAPLLAFLRAVDPAILSSVLSEPALLSEAFDSMARTALAATLSSLTLTGVGIPLAYVLARHEFRLKGLVEALIDIPLMLPHAVAGIMVLSAFGRRGLLGPVLTPLGLNADDTFWGIVAAMMFVSAPIAVDTIRVGIESVDPYLELVARSLGASSLRAFLTITLPMSARSVATGFILSWARAVSEVGAILIVAYYPKTINVLIMEWFNMYGLGYAVALALPLVVLSVALFALVRVVVGR